jgi:hypothetical protein
MLQVQDDRAPPAAQRIGAGVGGMLAPVDADHLRAHPGQQHPGHRNGRQPGELDDGDASQRSAGLVLAHLRLHPSPPENNI